jgi:hypothetical protein
MRAAIVTVHAIDARQRVGPYGALPRFRGGLIDHGRVRRGSLPAGASPCPWRCQRTPTLVFSSEPGRRPATTANARAARAHANHSHSPYLSPVANPSPEADGRQTPLWLVGPRLLAFPRARSLEAGTSGAMRSNNSSLHVVAVTGNSKGSVFVAGAWG